MLLYIILLVCALFLFMLIKSLKTKHELKKEKTELQKVKLAVEKYNPKERFDIRKHIDKIFVILMPSRLQHVKRSMKSYGINPKVINAIKKDTLDYPSLYKDGVITTELHLGKVACHLSHVKALKKFLFSKKAKLCMIFEDDIQHCFNRRAFEKRFAMMMDKLKGKENMFDIIYLGKCHDDCKKQIPIDVQLRTGSSPLCRHAYIVNRKAAHHIVNNTFPMDAPGDNMVRRLIDNGTLKCLTLYPSLFYQNRSVLGTYLNNNGILRECKTKDSYFGDFKLSPFYKVSVVILAENKENVMAIIKQYAKYKCVNDIIIFDAFDVLTNININHLKYDHVRVIEGNNITQRFNEASKHAKNKAVLLQDDDIILPKNTIIELANHLLQEPETVHGIFSVTNLLNVNNDVDIISTKAVMCRKSLCRKYYRVAGNNTNRKKENNIFSTVVKSVYKNKPKMYEMQIINI